MGVHQFLSAVLPEEPGVDRVRGVGRADRELPELRRLAGCGTGSIFSETVSNAR